MCLPPAARTIAGLLLLASCAPPSTEQSSPGPSVSSVERPPRIRLQFSAKGAQIEGPGLPPLHLQALTDGEGELLPSTTSRQQRSFPGGVEWWQPSPGGWEHGFDLLSREAAASPIPLLVGGAELRIDPDGRSATLDPPGSGPVWRYAGLWVEDAALAPIAARLEATATGIQIRLDAVAVSSARLPIRVDPFLTIQSWSAAGEQPMALFGTRVAAAGDLNADGFDDAAVSAPGLDGPAGPASGGIFVYLGGTAGLPATASLVIPGGPLGLDLEVVSGAGDVNADGYSDLLGGSPSYDGVANGGGAVSLFLGGPSGPGTVADWTLSGTQTFGQLGWDVETAGDVDGDGDADILVGAPGYSHGELREGVAFVFLGSPDGPTLGTPTAAETDADWLGESNQTDSLFGQAVAPAWDVNGDGFCDIVVGAPSWDGPLGPNDGRAFVFLGSATGLSSAPIWSPTGTANAGHFGEEVVGLGDTNGDGYSEVAIGSPDYSGPEAAEGRIQVFVGSSVGPATAPGWTMESNQAGAYFGSKAAAVGDADGDGFAELLVSAWGWTDGQADEGRVWFYPGSSVGLSTLADWTSEGNQVEALWGLSLAGVGDVNGDGYADWMVGAPEYDAGQTDEGTATLFAGSAGIAAAFGAATLSSASNGLAGSAVSGAGDVNGDGYDDLLVGAPNVSSGQTNEGRAMLHLGSPAGIGATPSWTVDSNIVNALMGSSVPGAGDLNGDGFDDVVVGSNFTADNVGGAWVYLGAAAGPATVAHWSIVGAPATGNFGFAVAGAGDVNADGFADVIIGSPEHDGALTNVGALSLFLGSAAGMPSSASWSHVPSVDGAFLGYSVDGAGDLDGDGFDDIVAGAPYQDGAGVDVGGLWVWTGSVDGLSSSGPNWTVTGTQANARLGSSVASAGDVDGDGRSDLIAGAPHYNSASGEEGQAHVWLGSPTGLGSVPNWTATGFWSSYGATMLGSSVASAGDIDRDGYGDLVIGAPNGSWLEGQEGIAYLFRGSPSGPISPQTTIWHDANTQLTYLGTSVTGAGDIDGDGFPDVAIGVPRISVGGGFFTYRGGSTNGEASAWSPRLRTLRRGGSTPIATGGATTEPGFDSRLLARSSFGRGRARLELEWQAQGTAFDAVGGAPRIFGSTWENTGTTGVTLTLPVEPIPLDTTLHYRARVRFDPALGFPTSAGPWQIAGPGGEPEGVHLRVPFLDADGDGSGVDVDCDDGDPLRFPNAVEDCDLIDQDCDGSVVEAFADLDADAIPDCVDDDDDGDGVAEGLDCDDSNPAILPGAMDGCDTIDSDCDGDLVDESTDQDGDGDPDCIDPDDDDDGSLDGNDCDDTDASIFPGAAESCDSIDSDCDGMWVDGDPDWDGDEIPDCVDPDDDDDGSLDAADCDDNSASIRPGAEETCDDIDSDCDASFVDEFTDTDGDGEPDCVDNDDDNDGSVDGDDCDDNSAAIRPGANETCDGVDSDCDGSIADEFTNTDGDVEPDCTDLDDDNDGSADSADCDDLSVAVYPLAPEICDGIDSDCDGSVADGFLDVDGDDQPACVDADDDGDGVDALADGGLDCDDAVATAYPGAPDPCDAVDQDCDSNLVEGYGDNDGDLSPDCADLDDDGDGSVDVDDCAPEDASIFPFAPESCDAVDSDCDGSLSDGAPDLDGDGDPDCIDDDGDGDGWDAGPGPSLDCDDSDASVHPFAADPCDGIDGDCDGDVGCTGDDDDTTPGDDDSAGGDDDSGDDDSTVADDDSTAGDDDSVTPSDEEPPFVHGGPGFVLSCSSSGGGGVGVLLLFALAATAISLRRRGRLLLLLLGLLPAKAQAGKADDLAGEIATLLEQWCTDADSADPGKASRAMEPIGSSLGRVTAFLDERGVDEFGWLLYWRGRLADCLHRDDLAAADYLAFMGAYQSAPTFRSLSQDARKRLRRLGVKPPAQGSAESDGLPSLSLGLGGGVMRLGDYSYGVFTIDVQPRIKGPLHALILVQPAIGPPFRYAATGALLDPPKRPFLLTFGAGLALRFVLPVRPEFGFGVAFAPNPARAWTATASYPIELPPLLIGPLLRAGVCVPLGKGAPVGLRISVEGPGMVGFPSISGHMALVIGA